MKIERDEVFEKWLIDKIAAKQFRERVGFHCTDGIWCINKQALRRLHPVSPSRSDTLRFGRGLATQQWLTGSLSDMPEVEVDGIVVTLDALYEDSPWELKDTDQSSNRPIEENIYQIRQVLAQCKVQKSLVGRLSRLENMGNWSWVYPKGSTKEEKAKDKAASEHPTLTAFKMTFTQQEVDANWQWLQERRRLFLGILETKALLPLSKALAGKEMLFECERCQYRGKECDAS